MINKFGAPQPSIRIATRSLVSKNYDDAGDLMAVSWYYFRPAAQDSHQFITRHGYQLIDDQWVDLGTMPLHQDRNGEPLPQTMAEATLQYRAIRRPAPAVDPIFGIEDASDHPLRTLEHNGIVPDLVRQALEPVLAVPLLEAELNKQGYTISKEGILGTLDDLGQPTGTRITPLEQVVAARQQTSQRPSVPVVMVQAFTLSGPERLPIRSERLSPIARCFYAICDWLDERAIIKKQSSAEFTKVMPAKISQPVLKAKSLPKPKRLTYSQERQIKNCDDMAQPWHSMQRLLNSLQAVPAGSEAAQKIIKQIKEYNGQLDLNNIDEAIATVTQTIDGLSNLRFGTNDEYADLLQFHFTTGGDYKNIVGAEWPKETFIATRDMLLPAGYGAGSISVIVPADVNVTQLNGRSHNDVYEVGRSELPLTNKVLDILCKRGFICETFDSSAVQDAFEKAKELSITISHHRELLAPQPTVPAPRSGTNNPSGLTH